jgi:16S rRNA (cytidine1402-2'-O)-methyltransferase
VNPGTLRICATPIGNLADCTPRVLEALRGAAVVACEDTRRTGTLLAAFQIAAPMARVDEHREEAETPRLIERLRAGGDVCLVSDAGLPAVSDPGRRLVAAAIEAGIPVEVLPGASAVTTALVASGLAADRFAFVGFLPRTGGGLAALLDQVDGWHMPVVAFEAPGRLPRTLAAIASRDPGRPVAVCRELTKLHEETTRGTAAEVAARYVTPPRGEVTLVLGVVDAPVATADAAAVDASLGELRAAGMGARQASELVARLTGLPRRDLYERFRSG